MRIMDEVKNSPPKATSVAPIMITERLPLRDDRIRQSFLFMCKGTQTLTKN